MLEKSLNLPKISESNLDLLLKDIQPQRHSLLRHPIYSQTKDLNFLRVFMTSHIFAIWDFMSLLKRLQLSLTSTDLPWAPPADILSARLINEIVLCEETDEIAPGIYSSHFELYLKAMKEVGAKSAPIRTFLLFINKGLSPKQAFKNIAIPHSTRRFVLNNMELCYQKTHEVAASFLFGREDIIPSMFRSLLQEVESHNKETTYYFRTYLERHIHLDEVHHAPMGRVLLSNLCGNDTKKWREATNAAKQALISRQMLWDGLLNQGSPKVFS